MHLCRRGALQLLQGATARPQAWPVADHFSPGILTAVRTKEATTKRADKVTRMFVHKVSGTRVHTWDTPMYDSRTAGLRGSPYHRSTFVHYGQRESRVFSQGSSHVRAPFGRSPIEAKGQPRQQAQQSPNQKHVLTILF